MRAKASIKKHARGALLLHRLGIAWRSFPHPFPRPFMRSSPLPFPRSLPLPFPRSLPLPFPRSLPRAFPRSLPLPFLRPPLHEKVLESKCKLIYTAYIDATVGRSIHTRHTTRSTSKGVAHGSQ